MNRREEEKKIKARSTRNKHLLVLYALLLLITSILVIITAGVVFGLEKPYLNKLENIYLDYSAAAIVLLVCGIIAMLLGCFYCCLLQKDDGKVTAMWATLLILFIAEFITACMCVWYKLVGLENLKYFLTPKEDEISEYLDKIQAEEGCCGYNGKEDYTQLPDSCCAGGICGISNGTTVAPYTQGCRVLFERPIHVFSWVIGITAIIAAFISACGFIGACYLERRPLDLSQPSQQK